jgi:hypothetical protein
MLLAAMLMPVGHFSTGISRQLIRKVVRSAMKYSPRSLIAHPPIVPRLLALRWERTFPFCPERGFSSPGGAE